MASRIARVGLFVTKVALVIAVLAAFGVAEWLRASRTDVATLLSMIGWGGFFALFFVWLCERPGPVAGLRAVGRVGVLTAVCGAVLYLYYLRSRILEAGVHVDHVYTYVGLRWFTELHNPITFAGETPSYPQMAMTLLTHLPALAVGFDHLGPFAVHLGMMVEVALVLAVLTTVLAPASSMTVQMAIAALAGAIFSNRMLVLIYNLPGYGVPAVCVGAIFLVVVDERALASPLRVVGGLLTLSLLHHYPGLFMALPLVVAWLILGRGPLRGLWSFACENLPLLLAVAILANTLVINPNLLLRRAIDVTHLARPFAMSSWAGKLQQSWHYLVAYYPADLKRFFFLRDTGSWDRLDLPAIGTALGLIALLNWGVSAATFRRRWLRYVLHLVGFASFLVVLSVLQHLVTDFSDYRDFTLIIALMVAGFAMLFRMPGLGRFGRAAVCAYTVALAVYNYVDLGALHGKRYWTAEYAHVSQRTMERLHAFVKRGPEARLSASPLYPVLDTAFPLLDLYLQDARTHGIEIRPIAAEDFCQNPEEEIEKALGRSCDAAVFALDMLRCPGAVREEPPRGEQRCAEQTCARLATLGWVHPDGPGTVVLYRYESACGREARDLAARGKPTVVEIAP